MPQSPQLPEDARAILALLLTNIQQVLGNQLVGLYLYGSLSSGDFDPASSDVDFLAVTQGIIADDVFERLRVMHEQVAASGLPFATKLEGSYIPREALRRYDPANALHPTIGNDWPFELGYHDANWIIDRAIVRERGVVLWGVPPATLIDPVSPQQLCEASCQQLADVWQPRIYDDGWPRPRLYPAFAVLTLCRALYTIQNGTFCSKPVAAAWAVEKRPDWRPVITWALAHRADHGDATPSEFAAAIAMLRKALAEAQLLCA